MAITYTWTDPDNTSLKFEDDATTPTTVKYVPVADGNRDYTAYLAWVAEGNTATAYAYPGYDTDIATARTTRIAAARLELTAFVRANFAEYAYQFVRSLADSTYTLPAGAQTKFDDVYALQDSFETDINSATVIENIRLSTIDFENETYNIPT